MTTKTRTFYATAVLVIVLITRGNLALAQASTGDGAANPTAAAASPTTAPSIAAGEGQDDGGDWIAYRQPPRKGPRTRVISMLRAEGKPPVVAVLAPEQNGRTTAERPTLLWYISAPTEAAVTIRLSREDETEPVYETTLKGVKRAGVQVLDLATAQSPGFTRVLEQGVEYTWSVEVDAKPNKSSSQATVERVALPAEMTKALSAASSARRAAMLARSGIWYDSVAEVYRQMSAEPPSERMRQTMRRLLEDGAHLDEPEGIVAQITGP